MRFVELTDNGGRRFGSDRRQFSYSFHIPERRIDGDRRSGADRRSGCHSDRDELDRRQAFQ